MYKKVFSFFIMFTMMLSAESIKAEYDVSYGIFGKIGTAKATLKKEHKNM